MPTIILYFNNYGFDMMEIMFLQSIFNVCLAVFEIPSGYFSDIIGRKKTLLSSAIFAILGFSIFAFTGGFLPFIFAEIILAMSSSLVSGTDSALLYESLNQLDRKEDYLKYEGQISASGNFAEGAAAIIGTYLAMINLNFPYYGQVVLSVIGLIAISFIIEPEEAEKKDSTNKIQQLLTVVVDTFKNAHLRWMILLSGLVGLGTLTAAWFAQEYFKAVEIPIEYNGYLWAALQFVVGFGAWFVNRITKNRSFLTIAAIISVGISFSFILGGYFLAAWAICFIFSINFFRGLAEPYFKNVINNLTNPSFRATVLSVRGLVIRFSFAIISPIIGWISDMYTIKYAFGAIGIFVFFASMIILLQLKYLQKPKLSGD